MAYLVHDAVTRAGVEILSFNTQHLRMIASSRKKTDRRGAYWIARAWERRGRSKRSVDCRL